MATIPRSNTIDLVDVLSVFHELPLYLVALAISKGIFRETDRENVITLSLGVSLEIHNTCTSAFRRCMYR